MLVLLGEGLATCRIAADGATVSVGPAIIGAEVNRRLAPLGRKIGPDPASINAAKIGGIAANNSSGMCCGTAQNSYRTLASLRVMFADGSVLDTGDTASRAAFQKSHGTLLQSLADLATAVQGDAALATRIRAKYKIKNTTGYSLNALVDYSDPVDILAHLMIGSEGTLGFIAEAVLDTVRELSLRGETIGEIRHDRVDRDPARGQAILIERAGRAEIGRALEGEPVPHPTPVHHTEPGDARQHLRRGALARGHLEHVLAMLDRTRSAALGAPSPRWAATTSASRR